MTRHRRIVTLLIALVMAVMAVSGIWLLLRGDKQMNGKEEAVMLNTLPADAEKGLLAATLSFKEIEGHEVAMQSGIPVPSFEPQKRQQLSLAGEWKKERFDADHDVTMLPRSAAWVKRVEAAAEGRTAADYDDSAWRTLKLPRPENGMSGDESAAGAEAYENGVWYRKTFELDDSWQGKAVTLKSLGISYVSDIWINGVWAGSHEGGYTPFALDITPLVTAGSNTIAIRVDNPPWGSRIDTIPAQAGTDFFNYTGIVQELYLEAASHAHAARVDIVPLDHTGHVKVKAVIENRGGQETKLRLEGSLFEAITDEAQLLASPYAVDIKGERAEAEGFEPQELTLPPWGAAVVEWDVRIANAKVWDMEHPQLYVAELNIAEKKAKQGEYIDSFATQFGVRTIKTEGTRILLNGEPIFLRGVARHEEWSVYGRTAEWSRIKDDLLQIKELNANMVRTGHYPNHVYTYLLTDRLGLAAMSEIPLWQFDTIHYEVQEKKRLSDQMWREMIFSQYNRPSVLLWSTQNESKDVALRKAYNERLVQDVRQRYDDGRLITQSAAADQPGAHDPSMEPLDVAAWTMYFGVFHGGTPYEGTRDFLAEAHRLWPNKPILNTEFGYWTQQDDSENEKQIEIYTDTLRALMEKATITMNGEDRNDGYVVGIDFWAMYNWYVNHSQWIQTMGLYHMDRTRTKPAKDLLQQDYGMMSSGAEGVAAVNP